ncbi:MAG: hypothetical protein HC771_20165 [Synechococcales cyanobacterium CRU_2_2]|nr:hypothetical protein [Synechococcales cyanobacterium CRU_2_2]
MPASQALNPFGLPDIGLFSAPVFADIDNDGDLDAFIGAENGDTLFFKNTGNSLSPVFSPGVVNPFGVINVAIAMGGAIAGVPQFDSNPSLVDIDNDGDLDLFIGTYPYGDTLFFRNTGSASNPVFAAPSINPFGLKNVGEFNSPTFVDIDNDGDFDAFIGNYPDGNTVFFKNTGSASNPVFAAPVANAFGLANIGIFSSPAFGDLDGDGDLDALVGTEGGDLTYFRNQGTAQSPSFAPAVINPFSLRNVGTFSSPEMTDIDGDGDLDVFVGTESGETFFFENNSTAGQAPQFFTYEAIAATGGLTLGSVNDEFILGSGHDDQIQTGDGRNLVRAGNGNDSIQGGVGHDTIHGESGHDWIDGGNGNDVIFGGSGDDVIFGGSGNDTLYGGDGNDRIQGGFDQDTLDGGAGIDTVDYRNWNDGATYNLATGTVSFPGSFQEGVINFENLETGDGTDHITGSSTANSISAGGGNDTLSGSGGNDTLTGGAGADGFRFNSLAEGVDTITDFSWQTGDTIQIKASSFGATSTQQFSYNAATGALSFNASPTDGIAPQIFAVLSNRPYDFVPQLDISLV